MFENQFLNNALEKAMKGNLADLTMIFSLLDGYLKGFISEEDFLNDIKVISSVKE